LIEPQLRVKPFKSVDAPVIRYLSNDEITRLLNACWAPLFATSRSVAAKRPTNAKRRLLSLDRLNLPRLAFAGLLTPRKSVVPALSRCERSCMSPNVAPVRRSGSIARRNARSRAVVRTTASHRRYYRACSAIRPRRLSQDRRTAAPRRSFADTSLMRIEQQLTQGDENNDAEDRRKEYGREGSG